MAELESTEFYEDGPTVDPESDEDDWFEQSQLGRADFASNNDLRGGDDGVEVEQP